MTHPLIASVSPAVGTERAQLPQAPTKKKKKLVNWLRVWRICAPFSTLTIWTWLYVWYLLPNTPAKPQRAEIQLRAVNDKLRQQNHELQQELYYEVGQNNALLNSMRILQPILEQVSLQLEIQEAQPKVTNK